jgi:REP element-mobilizing transposase RayT
MRRLPAQMPLGFTRKERVVQRQLRQRLAGEKVTPGPGRPKRKKADAITHDARPSLGNATALHVTLKLRAGVPNLRSGKPFAAVRKAFIKWCHVQGAGFRLIHFSVQKNHVHLLVEADSKGALSKGMQRLAHSISRRVNALSAQWIGRVFKERYHAHILKTPTEMAHAVRYVLHNHAHHTADTRADECSSFVQKVGIVQAIGFLLRRACERM